MAIKVKKPLSVVATVHPELAIMRDFLDATIKAGRDFDIELILVNSHKFALCSGYSLQN